MTMADLAVDRDTEREGWEAIRESAQEERMRSSPAWWTPPPELLARGAARALRALDRAHAAGDVSAAGGHPSDADREEAALPVLIAAIEASSARDAAAPASPVCLASVLPRPPVP